MAVVCEASQTADSVRAPHVLRPLEVTGTKTLTGMPPADAVTRISGAAARSLGIEAVKGVAEIAPNVYMPDYGSRMTSSIYVRGLGTRIDQPVMALNVDNVPIFNKDAYDFDIADLSSIEVIRGAQAILNGRNAMGGVINVSTLSPLTTKGVRASLSYGNANTVNASASVYGKLNRNIGMSVAAQFRHTDGFFKNLFTDKLLDHENSGSVRHKTVWQPSTRISLTNTLSVSVARQGGYPYAFEPNGKIEYNDTCSYRRFYAADGITLAYAGKRVVVTSLTSIQYLDDNMRLDQDFLPLDYFTLQQKRREWVFSEDLFVHGRKGAYQWLGGVFAFYRPTNMHAPVTFGDVGIARLIEDHRNDVNPDYPIEWDSRRFTLGSDFKLKAASFALYHQSSYTLGKWYFELGLRLDVERTALNYRSSTLTGFTTYHVLPDGSREVYSHTPIDIDDGSGLRHTYVEFLPKVNAEYRFSSALSVRATFSKAYKAGGYNTQMFSDVLQQRIMSQMGIAAPYTLDQIVSYRPEKSFNYEVGMKWSPTATSSVEANAFWIDCRDQQLTTFPAGTTTGRVMTNAGRTRSLGAELSLAWQPTQNVNLAASYGFTDARFRRYNDGRADHKGKRVPYAPANTLFVSASWRAVPWTFADIVPSFEASLRGVGNIMWNEANTASQPFYAIPGLSATLNAPVWSLQLWCRNLTDTRFNTFRFLSMGNAFVQRGAPRTFGVTLRLRIL